MRIKTKNKLTRKETKASSRSPSVFLKCFYCGFFWANILFVDSVIMFIECWIRIAINLLYLCCCSICCCGCIQWSRTKPLLIEIAIHLAVIFSLLLPICIILSFRNYSDSEEWDLLPFKTILGQVDLRRYFIIAFGVGGTATNVDNFNVDTCQDSLIGANIYSPKLVIESLNRTARGVS